MKTLAPLLLLLTFAAGATADEEAAAFFLERGNKALAAKNYPEAAAQFEKALAEMPGSIPALLGLAKAARGQDQKDEAVRRLEAILDTAEEQGTPGQEAAVEEARALLRQIDRFRLEYREMIRRHVGQLLDLATKSRETDPALARRCVDRILDLCPEHPRAKALRAELPEPAAPPIVKPGEVPFLNGRDFKNWFSKGPPIFSFRDGVLVVKPGAGTCMARTRDLLTGDYILEFEARLAEETGKEPVFVLGWGCRSTFELWQVEVFAERFSLVRYTGTEKDYQRIGTVEFSRMAKPLDRKSWNLFRVEVRGPLVRFFANGEGIYEYTSATSAAYEGTVSLCVQGCTAEFRRVSKVP